MDWDYSFEKPPTNEPCYEAFARTQLSIIHYSYFEDQLHKPMVLPYEMDKTIQRSRSKPVRSSRRSSRCHGSTLAISERPTRRLRSSVTLDTSPTANVNNASSESSPTSLTSISTVTKKLSPPKFIPHTTHLDHADSHASSPRPLPSNSKNELNDTEYLWDSVQFLSDPYVVALLSGEDPEVKSQELHENSNSKGCQSSYSSTNNNYVNCPVKSLVKKFSKSSKRKVSRRSKDTSGSATSATINSNGVNDSRLASIPKSFPRNRNGGNKRASPLVSPSPAVNESVHGMNGGTRRFSRRVPALPPPILQTVFTVCPARRSRKNSKRTNSQQSETIKGSGSDGDCGLKSHDKSKKAKIVPMADPFTATGKIKRNSWDEDED